MAAKPEESIIVGNTVLYGASPARPTSAGIAGERFAVRNSGRRRRGGGRGRPLLRIHDRRRRHRARQVGRNFAAGMSGGIAYVLDEDGTFEQRCNLSMIELEPITAEEEATSRSLHPDRRPRGHGLVDVMGDLAHNDAERLQT